MAWLSIQHRAYDEQHQTSWPLILLASSSLKVLQSYIFTQKYSKVHSNLATLATADCWVTCNNSVQHLVFNNKKNLIFLFVFSSSLLLITPGCDIRMKSCSVGKKCFQEFTGSRGSSFIANSKFSWQRSAGGQRVFREKSSQWLTMEKRVPSSTFSSGADLVCRGSFRARWIKRFAQRCDLCQDF